MAKSKPNRHAKSSQSAKSIGIHFPDDLREKLSEDLQLTGKSARTQQAYLRAVRQLSDFAKCSPDVVSEQQLRAYFLHLKNERQFAYGSLRVALSGIKFFFAITCRRDWDVLKMLKLQNITALPEVLTIRQVHQLIAATTNPSNVRVLLDRLFARAPAQRRAPPSSRRHRLGAWLRACPSR